MLLLPTDFSPHSLQAAQYAAHLAHHLKSEIVLFHCYHIPAVDPMMPGEIIGELTSNIKDEAETEIEKCKNQLKEYLQKNQLEVSIKSVIRLGFAVEEITEYVNESKPLLTVIGSRNRSGWERFLSGSILKPLIDSLNSTILVIPENIIFPKHKIKLLYASDFNDADISAIQQLFQILFSLKIQLTCLHIDTEKAPNYIQYEMDELQLKIQKIIENHDVAFDIVEGFDAKEGISSYLKNHDVDILCAYSTQKNFLEKLFEGSLTEHLAIESNRPLLVFKKRDTL